MSDDLTRLLSRRDARALARPDAVASGGSPAIMGRVTTSSAAPGTFFKLRPQVISGGECEACDATFTDAPATDLIAYNLGPATLAAGDKVVARSVASRWVAGRRSGGGGPDPDPITCLCWHDDDRPATLSYTADFHHIDSGTLLGSRSGTLTYMDPVTFAKAGGGTCTLSPPSGVAGWIGDWSDYCFILNPDDTVTGVERPHCMEDTAPSTCSDTGGTRCRYLWVACSPIGVGGGSPFGRVGVAETFYNAFASSYVCLAPNLVFAGASLACSPFSITYSGGSGRFGVRVDLTVTL